MAGVIFKQPTEPPRNDNPPEVLLRSLQMCWWLYRYAETVGSGPQIKLFLLYYDPALSSRLGHSTSLQKGLLGSDLFADREMSKQNNVVVTHELLHTLGATDNYDRASKQPLFPDGYAIPQQLPVLPQRYAEIMAGRIPLTENNAETPPD